jgi:hypothetical protein
MSRTFWLHYGLDATWFELLQKATDTLRVHGVRESNGNVSFVRLQRIGF